MGMRANIPKGHSKRAIKRARAMQAKVDAKHVADIFDPKAKLRHIFLYKHGKK